MNNQKNAVKYILSKRNKKCIDLAIKNEDYKGNDPKKIYKYDPRYVSKVIHRKIKINKEIESHWKSVLQVDSKMFMDDTGRTKMLSTVDVYKLDSYLENQYLLEIDEEDTSMKQSAEAQAADRRYHFESNITRLQRKIRKNIMTVDAPVDSAEAAQDVKEYNLWFFNRVLESRQKKVLEADEWKSLFQVFAHLVDDTPLEKVKEEESLLVYGLYMVIKKNRELKDLKDKRLLEDLIELFGFDIDECMEEYK